MSRTHRINSMTKMNKVNQINRMSGMRRMNRRNRTMSDKNYSRLKNFKLGYLYLSHRLIGTQFDWQNLQI